MKSGGQTSATAGAERMTFRDFWKKFSKGEFMETEMGKMSEPTK
jgi:hypothetical protein